MFDFLGYSLSHHIALQSCCLHHDVVISICFPLSVLSHLLPPRQIDGLVDGSVKRCLTRETTRTFFACRCENVTSGRLSMRIRTTFFLALLALRFAKDEGIRCRRRLYFDHLTFDTLWRLVGNPHSHGN